MSKYIRNTIINFFNYSVISLNDDIIQHIEKQVEKGIYAFQIIYTADASLGNDLIMKFELAKPLDYKLVEIEYEAEAFETDFDTLRKDPNFQLAMQDLTKTNAPANASQLVNLALGGNA